MLVMRDYLRGGFYRKTIILLTTVLTVLMVTLCASAGATEMVQGAGVNGKTDESKDMGHMHMGREKKSTVSSLPLLFNPAFGDDVYLLQPKGMWMVDYKFTHMNMDGLRTGTTDVPANAVVPMGSSPYGYMLAPVDMATNMQMLMAMYGVSDRLTLMVASTYKSNRMNMIADDGTGMGQTQMSMRTEGFGDTELRVIYGINKYLNVGLGIGIPTGSISQTVTMMGMNVRAPYDMQLGSGTVDIKPSLTYNRFSADSKWNWGGQATYNYHTGQNSNSYSLGNSINMTGWIQRIQAPYTSWLRLSYNGTGRIRGNDPGIQQLLDPMMGMPTPDADPQNYGGHELAAFIGVCYQKGSYSLGIEYGIPLYQSLNGLQLKNKSIITITGQLMF